MRKILIGISGWTYPGWRKNFYPDGLVQKKELHYASRKLNSIEINGTFYSLQKPESFQKWNSETPEDFCFSVKAPQYITHIRRLKEVEEPTANFFASGILCLAQKLGPILWQFPPNVMLKDNRFEEFLKLLPQDSKQAEKLAKKHSPKVEGRAFTSALGDYRIRHAFEFRHPSFFNPEFLDLLKKYNVAVVMAHSGLKSPYTEDITADFVYARMHGQDEEYKKGYTKEALSWWADRVLAWADGKEPSDASKILKNSKKSKSRDIYVYFDTEAKEHAPFDALSLIERLQKKIRKVG